MKEPSFYCENCGKPVALRANSCPSCGKSFEAVKCPECGFFGKSALFADGCPSCGYLSKLTTAVGGPAIVEVSLEEAGGARPKEARPSNTRGALPRWVYTLITVGLLGVLAVLLMIYLKLD
jgi:hypothetical protein